MSFFEEYKKNEKVDFELVFSKVSEYEIKRIVNKERINKEDFIKLLSPKAKPFLGIMAKKAQELSLKHFGKSVVLYTPIYISDYCSNKCSYCTFNQSNNIKRRKLSYQEIELEAKKISKSGLKHILLLTGGSRKVSSVAYVIEAVKILKKYFDSVSIEIYALHQFEYKKLIEAGIDGVTIYQEVYNQERYMEVHLAGPKRDYLFRIDAPERACKEKINKMNIGVLMGLYDFRKEIFFTALHGKYLNDKYPDVEMSFSLPRIRKFKGTENFDSISDIDFVQMLAALRIYLPYFSINISTRESNEFRRNLLPIGVNKMSAGVSTAVGGHIDNDGEPQFEIDDYGSVEMVKEMINEAGFQPILKDWFSI
jgi:2-iminoacetate synthase